MNRVKVLVVDDSAVVRQVVGNMIAADPRFVLLGAVADPFLAIEKMRLQWPDVIVLDIEMPKMDGITFLRKIMKERPTPVIICSTLAEAGARVTIDALAAGAVAIIQKPKLGLKSFLGDASEDLIASVLCAAGANAALLARPAVAGRVSQAGAAVAAPGGNEALIQTTERVVAIGTSTGGTQALEVVLSALPPHAPGIVVVQHMPEKFTAAFAERLDSVCRISVVEARHQMRVLPGQALIAPGGKHMLMRRNGAQYVVDVIDGPLVNRHRPSVDVLFRSVAKCAGDAARGRAHHRPG
jgi:two-component system chemotaxis response regulator CheB